MLRESEHDGRRHVGKRRAVPLGQRQILLEVEARHGDNRGALAQTCVHDDRLSVAVEEGQDRDNHIVEPERSHDHDLERVRDEVAMRQHHPLR
jgi:hypothetical protein